MGKLLWMLPGNTANKTITQTWSKLTKPANLYILVIQTITTAKKWTTKFFGTLLFCFF